MRNVAQSFLTLGIVEKLSAVAILLIVVGFFISPAFISIGTGILVGTLIIRLAKHGFGFVFQHQGVFYIITGCFLVYLLLSYFYTDPENIGQYFKEVSMRLAFFSILFGFAGLKLPSIWNRFFMESFCWLVAIVAIGTFINYLLHFEEINAMIDQSKPIPILFGNFHITFSLFMSFASIYGAWQLFNRGISLLTIPTVILFLLLHVIAARTGLFSFYTVFFAMIILFGILKNRGKLTVILLLALAIAGVTAIKTISPLNHRYLNTLEDLKRIRNAENPNWWSGAMRFEAMETGWDIFLDNPIFGVGMADISTEMGRKYEERKTNLMKENRIEPHNQFLNYLVTGGLVSLILFVTMVVSLLATKSIRKNPMLWLFVLLFTIAFQFEAFLERQAGSAFVGLILMLIYQLDNESIAENSPSNA